MNQELHARRNPVARASDRREVIQRTCLIQEICGGLHSVIPQDAHHPGQHQVIGLEEAAVELGGRSGSKTGRPGVQQQIVVVSVHVQAEQVEGAIVEAEVAAEAIERLTSGNDGSVVGGIDTVETLYRPTSEIESAQVQVGMVARAQWLRPPGCRDGS